MSFTSQGINIVPEVFSRYQHITFLPLFVCLGPHFPFRSIIFLHCCDCYNFGSSMVQTACLFTVHVSGLLDLFGTGSNIFDPCLFLYYLYLVFPFPLRQSSLASPLVSSVLVFPFYGHFQRLLIHTYVG
jgi:hypothetical protein